MNQMFNYRLMYKRMKGLLFLLPGLLIMFSCGSASDPAGDEAVVRTSVEVTNVNYGTAEEWIGFNAVSVFQVKNSVKSSITGTVETVAISPGEQIKQGQLLFILKTKEASALSSFQPSDSLAGFKGLVRIYSTRQGIVSSVVHQKGDYVLDGDELAVIAEPSSLIFLAEVPFDQQQYIHRDETCVIEIPGRQNLRGKIRGAMPSMDIQLQTMNFIVKPETGEFLPENLIARVKIVKTAHEHAVLLPKKAILSNETQTNFWVMKLINDSIAVKVPVKTGIETDHSIEILNPVFNPSDRILVQGNYGLPDTALVSVQK